MNKTLATALAAGALTFGGAASAQNIGDTVLNILGFGAPTYQTYTTPAVVAGTTYRDSVGRTFYYDQHGRQVYVEQHAPQLVGYDAWGRPVYTPPAATFGTTPSYPGYAYNRNNWDYDGDGVANNRDRWPGDPRYR